MVDRELREELALDQLTADMDPDQAQSMRQKIREKADMIRESPKEVLDGMRAVRNLTLATGSPAPRTILPLVVDATAAGAPKKEAWKEKIMKALPAEGEGLGCIQMEFHDILAKKRSTVRLTLEPCDAAHDLGVQLDKIYSRLSPQKHGEVRKHLGMLIHCGRAAYGEVLHQLGPVARKIKKSLPEGGDMRMAVDPENTTLFVDVAGTKRVGIFVHVADADAVAVDNDDVADGVA